MSVCAAGPHPPLSWLAQKKMYRTEHFLAGVMRAKVPVAGLVKTTCPPPLQRHGVPHIRSRACCCVFILPEQPPGSVVCSRYLKQSNAFMVHVSEEDPAAVPEVK